MQRYQPYSLRSWNNKDANQNRSDENKVTSGIKTNYTSTSNNQGLEGAGDEGFFEQFLPEPEELDIPNLTICAYHDFGEEAREPTVMNENNQECLNGWQPINNTPERKKDIICKPLLTPVTYFLNKSKSKWICVGLDSDFNFEPVIRLMGNRGQGVTLNADTWSDFNAVLITV